MSGNAIVFWDLESCRPPEDKTIAELMQKLCDLAGQNTSNVNIYLDVVAESERVGGISFLQTLFMSGASLIHCPANVGPDVRSITMKMINDIQSINAGTCSQISAIVVISAEATLSYPTSLMKLRGYNVIFVKPCVCTNEPTREQGTYCWKCHITEQRAHQHLPDNLAARNRQFSPSGSSVANNRISQPSMSAHVDNDEVSVPLSVSGTTPRPPRNEEEPLKTTKNNLFSTQECSTAAAPNSMSSAWDKEDLGCMPNTSPKSSKMPVDFQLDSDDEAPRSDQSSSQRKRNIYMPEDYFPEVASVANSEAVSTVEVFASSTTYKKRRLHTDREEAGAQNHVHPPSLLPPSSAAAERPTAARSEAFSKATNVHGYEQASQQHPLQLDTEEELRPAFGISAHRLADESLHDASDKPDVPASLVLNEAPTPIQFARTIDVAFQVPGSTSLAAQAPKEPQSHIELLRAIAGLNKYSRPAQFNVLIEAMEEIMVKNSETYVNFSDLDTPLKARDPLVYPDIGVSLLSEYLDLAERFRIVSIFRPSPNGQKAVQFTERYARYMEFPEFRHLLDVLWGDRDEGITISRSAQVGAKLHKKDHSIYKTAGVSKLKPYIQLAEKKGIVYIPELPVVHEGSSKLCSCMSKGQFHVQLREVYLLT